VIFPISTVLVATAAMRSVLAQIKHDGSPINVLSSLLPFNDFLDFIGLTEIRELERRFSATGSTHGDAPATPEEA
jgi:2,3-dimethylmalate lyase